MNDLETSFSKLLGRQPSDAEKQKLYTVRDALNLKNNDALWLVLMALEHYQSLYEKLPREMNQATNETLDSFKRTADAIAHASIQSATDELSRSVSQVAREVAYNTSAKQMWQWGLISIAISTFLVLGLAFFFYSRGSDSGYNLGLVDGYSKAKDEKAAAAWANTPEGKLAFRLAQAGSISNLARCDKPGWKSEKGICYVEPTEKGTYGWRLPQ